MMRTAGHGEIEWGEFADRFLDLLDVPRLSPSLEALTVIVQSFLARIPFENISKLLYLKRHNLRSIPNPTLYLDGTEQHHFGGTCYSNNYYLFRLLEQLGYEVRYCGADMREPNVHTVNVVELEGRSFLIDVGNAAPFVEPLPLDEAEDVEVPFGSILYRLKPRDSDGRSRMENYHDGVLTHGYTLNPEPQTLDFFAPVIADSFEPYSTFMNSLLITRFEPDRWLRLLNFELIDSSVNEKEPVTIPDTDSLIQAINSLFDIPSDLTREAIDGFPLCGSLS